MKRKLFTLFAFVLLICCVVCLVTACDLGIEGPSGNVIVTYYLYDNMPAFTVKVSGGKFSFDILPSQAHTRFLGMFTQKEGGTQIMDEQGRCLVDIEESVTLWAHWENNECTIEFYAGGGTCDTRSTTMRYNDTISQFPSASLTGYDFVGWSNNGEMVSNGTTPLEGKNVLNSSYVFEEQTDTVKLVAIYKIQSYELTLFYNDGSNKSIKVFADYGQKLDQLEIPPITYSNGLAELVGWSADKDSDKPFDGPVTSPMSLFAIWRKYRATTLYITETDQEELHVFLDETETLPEPQRNGYKFLGWYDNNAIEGEPVKRVSYDSLASAYYASWSPIQYAVSFQTNGGSAQIEPINYTAENEVLLPDAGTRQYYTFEGWCRNEDLSDTPVDTLPKGTYGDITLYAKWKGDDRTIRLDAQGGNVSLPEAIVEYGTEFELEVPMREGYTFVGWYLSDGTPLTDSLGKSLAQFDIIEETTSAVAHWEINKYTVSYQTNGGSHVDDQVYEHGQPLTFPQTPTKENMQLEGWYLDSEFHELAREGTAVTSPLTLFAKWYQATAISTAEEFANISLNPTYNYFLTGDINMKGKEISPIQGFSGSLDGRGYRVYNFIISFSSTVENLGLFAQNDGVIKNLTLDAVVCTYVATSANHAGVLAGTNNGTVENCKIINSDITAKESFYHSNEVCAFGCFVGHNAGTVVNCEISETRFSFTHVSSSDKSFYPNEGEYNPKAYVGGIVGENSGKVEGCHSRVEISITQHSENKYYSQLWYSDCYPYPNTYVGGVVGYQNEQGVLSQSEFRSTLKTTNTKTVREKSDYYGTKNYVGGLVGEAYGTITQCKVNASLTSSAYTTAYLGGLAGVLYGSVSNCYTNVALSAGATKEIQISGGFVGINYGTILNSYASGSIESVLTSAGGFCGVNASSGSIIRCISLTKLSCSGTNVAKFVYQNDGTLSGDYVSDNVCQGGAFAPDLVESHDALTIFGREFLAEKLYWDEDVWYFDPSNATYPKLLWEM